MAATLALFAPVLAWADTRNAPEGARKVGGFGIAQFAGNVHNRFIRTRKQLYCCVIPGAFEQFTIV